jgi:hypothetical protein
MSRRLPDQPTRPRLTPFQRRLVAAVDAEPGRITEHYASVLGARLADVERAAYVLWERGEIAADDEDSPDIYLWPFVAAEEGTDA